MKSLAWLLCCAGLLAQQTREGNFEIGFDPVAMLQTGAEIPFSITVKDGLHHPISDAKVVLQIETPDNLHGQSWPANAIDTGTYLAKPVFPVPGQWNVRVEAVWQEKSSSRTKEYVVPQ